MRRLSSPQLAVILTALVLLMTIATAIFAVFVFLGQRQEVLTNCREIELVRVGLRESLEEAQHFAASSPVRSAAQKHAIVTFYAGAVGREVPRALGRKGPRTCQ